MLSAEENDLLCRVALDAAQQVIFLWGQHGVLRMDNLAI